MQVRVVTIFLLSIALALISPPFIFARMDFSGQEIRAVIGLLLIMILVFGVQTVKLIDAGVIVIALLLFMVEIVWQRSQLSNIFSYYAVIVVCFLLYRELRYNKKSGEIFLSLWIKTAYIISMMSIFLFVLHQFTSIDSDYFNFFSAAHFPENSNYRASILGLTQDKSFGFFTVERVDGYFDEPQYAGLYFAINMLIGREFYKAGCHQSFFVISILGGLLTFSVTFYMALLVMLVFTIKPKDVRILFILSSLTVLVGVVSYYIVVEDVTVADVALLKNTSFSDRVLRLNNSVNIIYDAPLSKLFFGHGAGFTNNGPEFPMNNVKRGISSGFFHIWVERGLVGLFFVLTVMILYLNKKFITFMILLMFLLSLPWYKNYIYWYGIILFGVISINLKFSRELNGNVQYRVFNLLKYNKHLGREEL